MSERYEARGTLVWDNDNNRPYVDAGMDIVARKIAAALNAAEDNAALRERVARLSEAINALMPFLDADLKLVGMMLADEYKSAIEQAKESVKETR